MSINKMQLKPTDIVTLKYWKKVEMPEKARNAKGDYEKTGKSVEMTGYSFHDLMGEELYFISPKNEFRSLEGKHVTLVIKATYDDYGRKNKYSLESVEEAKNVKNNNQA